MAGDDAGHLEPPEIAGVRTDEQARTLWAERPKTPSSSLSGT